MFTSKEHLHTNLGLDSTIAKFFVDRKVPDDNHYWKGRYLYVAKGTGYLFIPIYFDLQYKCGMTIEQVLDEDYIKLMENILDSAAMHEMEEISFATHLANCKTIIEGKVNNDELYRDLEDYFSNENLSPYKNLGTTSKALNRGDTLLFSLCYPNLDPVMIKNIVTNWYALVPSFLLMDDIIDLHEDRAKNEENSINDFGQGNEGVEKAIEFLRNKFNRLKLYNEKLGSFFERSLERKMDTPYMQSLLNPNEHGS